MHFCIVSVKVLNRYRQFNNWLHKYIYKKNYENEVGLQLRNLYERAKIQTEQDFKEAMNDVLSNR